MVDGSSRIYVPHINFTIGLAYEMQLMSSRRTICYNHRSNLTSTARVRTWTPRLSSPQTAVNGVFDIFMRRMRSEFVGQEPKFVLRRRYIGWGRSRLRHRTRFDRKKSHLNLLRETWVLCGLWIHVDSSMIRSVVRLPKIRQMYGRMWDWSITPNS